MAKFEIKIVGGSLYQKYWISAEELEAFNSKIIDRIEVIAEFYPNN